MNKLTILKSKKLRYGVAAIITLASTFVMLRLIWVSKDQLIGIHLSFKVIPLLLTFPLFLLTAVLTGYIWGQMMCSLDRRVSQSHHVVIYLATLFAGRLPGGIWNVVGRIAWYEKIGIRKRVTTFASVLQWFMILWSGIILLILVLPFIIGLNLRNITFLAVPFLFLALLINPRIIRFLLKKLLNETDLPKIEYGKILYWLFLYLVIWTLGGTILYIVVVSMYFGVSSWIYCLAAWSSAGVSGTLVTFLPSGLGVSEMVSSLLLSSQLPSSISVIVSLIMRVLLTIYEFLISLTFLIISRYFIPGKIIQD